MNDRKRKKGTPPRVRYPGVRTIWRGKRGWGFRASADNEGMRTYGPTRETQVEASDDYRRMVAKRDAGLGPVVTIAQALRRVVVEAETRGVPQTTIDRHLHCHGRYLQQTWPEETKMAAITQTDVMRFVRDARAAGRSPNTLLQKDLPLLARCYAAAQIRDPVPAVRKALRATLKYVPPAMSFLTAVELRSVLDRIRAAGSEADADLIELIALTGVRAGELGRIRVDDIDDARRRIRVISKDRGHPRHLEIIQPLVPIVDRLRAAAVARGDGVLVPSSMTTVTRVCTRWQKRLKERRLTGRALRHTFVTGLLYSGAQPVEAQGLAGHRDLSTTSRYVHEISSHRSEAVARWARTVQSEEPPTEPPGSP